MIVVSRKRGERMVIGLPGGKWVTVEPVDLRPDSVRLGLVLPPGVEWVRAEQMVVDDRGVMSGTGNYRSIRNGYPPSSERVVARVFVTDWPQVSYIPQDDDGPSMTFRLDPTGLDVTPHVAFVGGSMPPWVYADWLEENGVDLPPQAFAVLGKRTATR